MRDATRHDDGHQPDFGLCLCIFDLYMRATVRNGNLVALSKFSQLANSIFVGQI